MLDYPIRLLELFLLFIPTLVRLAANYYKIEIKKETIGRWGYFTQNIWTGGLILGVSLIDFYLYDIKYLFQPVCLSIAIFVLLFDELLNYFRNKPFGYYGQASPDKSIIEQWVATYIPNAVVLTFIRIWIVVFLAIFFYGYSKIIS